jgi:hypothetical protein
MLDPVELIRQLQESVHTIGVEIGRVVASKLLEDEVQQICGEPYERGAARTASRHGRQRGWISISGRRCRSRSRESGPMESWSWIDTH